MTKSPVRVINEPIATNESVCKYENENEYTNVLKKVQTNDPIFKVIDFKRYALCDEDAMELVTALQTNTVVERLIINKMWMNLTMNSYTALAKTLSINTTLQVLKVLEATNIDNNKVAVLAKSVKHNTSLSVVYISCKKLKCHTMVAILESLLQNKILTSIYLLYDELEFYSIQDKIVVGDLLLDVVQNNTSLQKLKLSNNSSFGCNEFDFALVDRSGIQNRYSVASNITKLSILDLSGCNIGNTAFDTLVQGLKFNTSLKTLRLSNNSIDDANTIELADMLRVNERIEIVDLSYNLIGDDGIIAIANGLYWNSSLSELVLSNNTMTDCGAKNLAKSIRYHPTLDKLWIGGNVRVTDIGVAHFLDSFKYNEILSKFDIRNVQLGNDLLQKLRNVADDDDHYVRYNDTMKHFLSDYKYNIGMHIERWVNIQQQRGHVVVGVKKGVSRRWDVYNWLLFGDLALSSS